MTRAMRARPKIVERLFFKGSRTLTILRRARETVGEGDFHSLSVSSPESATIGVDEAS
jgi:hypothetical protein